MANSYLASEQWPELRKLFNYALEFVTAQDVSENVPSDPGTAGYVSQWTKLIETGQLRLRSRSDYGEVIGCVNSVDADDSASPTHFRRFRVFACSVGMLFAANHDSEVVHPTNYLLVRLLQDQAALADLTLSALLVAACQQLQASLRTDPWESEHPFCTLAIILLQLSRGEPAHTLQDLASTLIADDDSIRKKLERNSKVFLLGLTEYDFWHDEWRQLVKQGIPATVAIEELAMIRQAILAVRY